jgi:uncharacterized membrane protein
MFLLIGHGGERTTFGTFKGQSGPLTNFGGIASQVAGFHAEGLIQLGLVLLILTPVLRVAMSVYAFIRLRGTLYVVVTSIVLGVLLFGLSGGR